MLLVGLIILSLLLVPTFLFDNTADDGSVDCISKELTQSYINVPEKISGWSSASRLDLYHCNGFQYHIAHMFMDVYLQINLTNEQSYQIYQGENCSAVLEHYRDDQRLWGLVRRVKLLRSKQLSPFQKTFVGVSTPRAYSVRIRVWRINYIRLAVFIGGIVLFLMAHTLVRNAIFYYTSGCTIGVLASLLIVGFIVYRLTPKTWVGIPFVFSGWSVSFYIIYMIWKNFASLILQYQKFVAAYFATVVLVSFAVCYRYGPPTDVRSHNLAQWALQLIALILIYSCCQITDVSIGVILFLLMWSGLKEWLIRATSKFVSVFKVVWNFMFPKYQRLLTMEEYRQQGEEETRKALEKLRQYCKSPEANAWKITSSMSDPKRFAGFVDGSFDHVSEEESRLYDMECTSLDDLSDDSGEDEYVVAQRSRLTYSDGPSRRCQVRENSSPSQSQRIDRSSFPRRNMFCEREMNFDTDEDDKLTYDWRTHSLPLRNPRRKCAHRLDLYEDNPVTSSSFRNDRKTLSRSPPTADLNSDAEIILSLQNR